MQGEFTIISISLIYRLGHELLTTSFSMADNYTYSLLSTDKDF